MKGFVKISILSLMLMFAGVSAYAQFNIGVAAAFNTYKGKDLPKKAHPALQLRLGYDGKNAGYFINAGFNYSPTKAVIFEQYVEVQDEVTKEWTEYFMQMNMKRNNAFLHVGYALFPVENDFHVRLFGGPSVDLLSVSWEIDEDLPAIFPRSQFKDTTMTGWKLDVGVGIDLRIGNGKLFAEYTLGIPANEKNGQPYLNPTVGHRGITMGYSFLIGNRRDYW